MSGGLERAGAAGRVWPWIVLAMAGLGRLVGMLVYPVPGFPDSQGYLAYADRILGVPGLWTTLEDGALAITALRPLAYPGLLAMAERIAGDSGPELVIALQCVAHVLAVLLLYRAIEHWTGRPTVAGLSAIGASLGYGLTYDLALLPDSFSISAWIACAAMLLMLALDQASRPWRLILASSLSLMVIVAMRGNGLHMAALLLPLAVIAIWRAVPLGRARPVAVGVLLLPALAWHGGVSFWNHSRTGVSFYTTGGVLALMQPVQRMQARDPGVVDAPGRLADLMRELNPTGEYAKLYDIAEEMRLRHGLKPWEIQAEAQALLLQAIRTHPGAYLRTALRNFDDKFAIGLINPALGLNEAHFLLTDRRAYDGFSRLVRQDGRSLGETVYIAVYAVGLAVSAVLFLAAVVVLPVRALTGLRGARATRPAWLPALAIWAACVGGVVYYSALFMELRYVAQFQPWMIALGLLAMLGPRRI